MSSSTTSENPFSSSPASSRQKIGSPIEARIAPPHHTRRRIDQRSRAPVADDGKIEPVIDHEAASASVREICSSQWRTSVGRSKQDLTPGTFRPTEIPMPSKSGMISNTPRSVSSSPRKIGAAIGKRRVGHQFAHGGRLGETGLLDFYHQLSRQQFDRGPLELSDDLGGGLSHQCVPSPAPAGSAAPASNPCLRG